MPYRPSGSVGVFDDSRQATHCWNDDGAEPAPLLVLAGVLLDCESLADAELACESLACAVLPCVVLPCDVLVFVLPPDCARRGASEALPPHTCTSSPTVMTFGLVICGLSASTRASDCPDCAAMPLSVSPACTVWVLAIAGPAARTVMAVPVPTAVIIRVRTLIILLVGVALPQRPKIRSGPGRCK